MSVTFVLSLIQDVAVLAPLVRRAAGRDAMVLIARRLADEPRAADGLRALVGERPSAVFANTGEALLALDGRTGLVVFASESRSVHHAPTHALAAALPARFVGATLQHGFECIGFLHNASHDANRADAGFAADLACAWFAADRLDALPPMDRARLMVTGSTLFLDPEPAAWLAAVMAGERAAPRPGGDAVLVCENVQSVRLAGAPADEFRDALASVAERWPVVLRPHPAGPFAKGEMIPPPGVVLDARPIGEAELDRYRAAISPPSTVLFDLIARDVPVALWRDSWGLVDERHYGALTRVTSADDWLAFFDAPPDLERQRGFVRALGFPADTPARFDALLAFADDLAPRCEPASA